MLRVGRRGKCRMNRSRRPIPGNLGRDVQEVPGQALGMRGPWVGSQSLAFPSWSFHNSCLFWLWSSEYLEINSIICYSQMQHFLTIKQFPSKYSLRSTGNGGNYHNGKLLFCPWSLWIPCHPSGHTFSTLKLCNWDAWVSKKCHNCFTDLSAICFLVWINFLGFLLQTLYWYQP